MIGAAIAVIGESIRAGAAGHLEKSKEVTQSGPYRYTRHPLYLGSSLIGIGHRRSSPKPGSSPRSVIAYLALTLDGAIAQRRSAPAREVRRCV
jgi:protein-S-isoprenylcysteine O-methyltransferase Ste14